MKVIVKVRFRDLEEGRVIRKVDEVLNVTPERAAVLIGKGFVQAVGAAEDVTEDVTEDVVEDAVLEEPEGADEGAEKAPRRTKRN